MMGYGYGYGPGMMGGLGWAGWIIGLLFFALIVIGVILLVLWMVRASARHPGQPMAGMPSHMQAPRDEAMDIARRRLAAGEITADQYEEIRKSLEASKPSGG